MQLKNALRVVLVVFHLPFLSCHLQGEVMLRFVVSKHEQEEILLSCHVDPTAGHMGRTRTLYRIKERFMWHGMVKDVQDMVSGYTYRP